MIWINEKGRRAYQLVVQVDDLPIESVLDGSVLEVIRDFYEPIKLRKI